MRFNRKHDTPKQIGGVVAIMRLLIPQVKALETLAIEAGALQNFG